MPTAIEPLPLNRWTEWPRLLRSGWPEEFDWFQKDDQERFYSCVTLNDDPDGCWKWSGELGKSGYGRFRLGKLSIPANRVSIYLSGRRIPKGLFACHHCDNPICVRIDHLFVGTTRANALDMVRKQRNAAAVHPELVARGTRVNTAKLNEEKVRRILALRKAGWSLSKLARHFEVTFCPISTICAGTSWKHVSRENLPSVAA